MSDLVHPHPTAELRTVAWPRANLATKALLATEGLELTFNARGALLTAYREVRAAARIHARPTVLMPAYHCPSAITPAMMAGLEPVFYRIRPDLSIDWEDVEAKTTPATAAMLVIHFFGVAPDLEPLSTARRQGVRLIEDCSHAFVSVKPLQLAGDHRSDYRVFSFWKLAPSGIGGGLLRAASVLPAQPRPAAPLKESLRNYKLLVEEAIQSRSHGGLRWGFNAIEQIRLALRPPPAPAAAGLPSVESGESYYPVHTRLALSSMPAHVRRAIESTDIAAAADRRRANFLRYRDHLDRLAPMSALVPVLPESTCPWVFPVLLAERDGVDRRLREAGMALHTFGIYLHSRLFETADPATIADARLLADQVLCLAIHQDISPDDIDRGCAAAQHILRTR